MILPNEIVQIILNFHVDNLKLLKYSQYIKEFPQLCVSAMLISKYVLSRIKAYLYESIVFQEDCVFYPNHYIQLYQNGQFTDEALIMGPRIAAFVKHITIYDNDLINTYKGLFGNAMLSFKSFTYHTFTSVGFKASITKFIDIIGDHQFQRCDHNPEEDSNRFLPSTYVKPGLKLSSIPFYQKVHGYFRFVTLCDNCSRKRREFFGN